MATNTTNYNLVKPSPTDTYDIAVQNSNMDKVDTALKNNANTLTAHKDDGIVHITTAERNTWNAKETTTGAQTKATTARNEAISTAASDATTKANAVQANLDSHASNNTAHITASERAAWNAKTNVIPSTSAPNNSQGANGDVFLRYS